MTFYEAAVKVLRDTGRALHYKKITEYAIRQKLLTHVGRTPEQTMQSRLKQEIARGEDSILTEVRPGIYELRKDADTSEAAETLQLRTAAAPNAHDEGEELDDADDSDDDSDSGDDSDDDSNAAQSSTRKRRRRRGKRAGRGRGDDDSDSDSDSDDDSDDSDGADEQAAAEGDDDSNGARESRRRPSRSRRSGRSGRSNRSQSDKILADPDELDDSGDFARAVVEIFHNEDASELSQRQLAGALARRPAALRLSPSRIRASLEEANRRRAINGWPPLFIEVKAERWALATASGDELAKAYSALQAWRVEHRDILRRTLTKRIENLDVDALAAVVTLLLEKLGYRDITQHDPASDEHCTLSASLENNITRSKVAVRIMPTERRLSRADIQAFRGGLHLYQADDAAILATGGFGPSAASEAEIPNLATISILSASELAKHLIRHRIGVSNFTLDVSCVDETFFSDFSDER